MSFDYALLARLLLTLVTLGYAVAPLIADLNKTHVTNPKWTPHARFHVVWQISSYTGIGLIALALIWRPGPDAVVRLYLAALFAVALHAGFFVALFTMRLYGGASYDDNGHLPIAAPVPLFSPKWDVNLTVLSGLTILLLAAVLSIAAVD